MVYRPPFTARSHTQTNHKSNSAEKRQKKTKKEREKIVTIITEEKKRRKEKNNFAYRWVNVIKCFSSTLGEVSRQKKCIYARSYIYAYANTYIYKVWNFIAGTCKWTQNIKLARFSLFFFTNVCVCMPPVSKCMKKKKNFFSFIFSSCLNFFNLTT